MKIGTKSLLFGVHQFIVHPVVVGRAWRALYGRWPNLNEWIAIMVHDWGYWGCPNMDGPEGRRHPEKSACIAYTLAKWAWHVKHLFHPRLRKERGADVMYAAKCAFMVLLHSRETVKAHNKKVDPAFKPIEPSALCWPDKYSVCLEWPWFYLLRAKLSGEIHEFKENAVKAGKIQSESSAADWFEWYANVIYYLPQVSRLRTERFDERLGAWLKANR